MIAHIDRTIRRGDLDEIRAIYRCNQSWFDPSDALCLASHYGNLEISRYFIEEWKASVNYNSRRAGTGTYGNALLNTINSGCIDLLQYILPRIDGSFKIVMGIVETETTKAALRTACQLLDLSIIKVLHQHFHYDPLEFYDTLIWIGDPISGGADSMSYPENYKRAVAIVEYFISQGLDINRPTHLNAHHSPIIHAVMYNRLSQMRVYHRCGAVIPEEYWQTRKRENAELCISANWCDQFIERILAQEMTQKNHYQNALEELAVQLPRNRFPGGEDYRAARDRMVESGMTDILISINELSALSTPNDIRTLSETLNITIPFPDVRESIEYLKAYATQL